MAVISSPAEYGKIQIQHALGTIPDLTVFEILPFSVIK
jgi:hypothetical protein